MAEFMIRFFLCNISISILIGILLCARHLFQNSLTSQMRYNLWFLLLGVLTVPFLPIPPIRLFWIFSWLGSLKNASPFLTGTIIQKAAPQMKADAASWMNDFSITISQKAPSAIGFLLCALWIFGILILTALLIKSMLRLNAIKKSALPLQNPAVRRLYQECLSEMRLAKPVPVYSTAFLKSPMIAGLAKPRIYLPIHLISNYNANDLRYMLLHELGHYKHKDVPTRYLMNLIGILYWFNPFVWYSLKEMKNDGEVACDASVLRLLSEDDYEDYGNTLINFAEKASLTPFPFAAGISGSMKQMQKRVIHIASYRPASLRKNIRSALASAMIACFLLGAAPILSIQAADPNPCYFNEAGRKITYLDLSSSFEEYHGSFVLYDEGAGSWMIYNRDAAVTRISPASTYKIYSALFGLESGAITPEQSQISWNGQHYFYDSWNADQNLESAMQNSVTWYFQALDRQTSLASLKRYVQKTGYGNRLVEGDPSSYWMNGSLKISPVEQIELLEKLYHNQFGFSPENVQAIKDSILLSSTDRGALFGKTGTEERGGENVSGWFVGYIEKDGYACFFATNIQNERLASGPAALKLTLSILSDLGIWNADQSASPDTI